MTAADLIRSGACTSACIAATSTADRCACPCAGQTHGLLAHAHLDGLLEARRAGLHLITDRGLIEGIA